MPLYAFRCDCGNTIELIRELKRRSDQVICELCGADMERDYMSEGGAIPVGTENANMFFSDSLAISPDQVAEHRERFPDVPIDREGRPGFASHKQREKYCDDCGFVKVPHNREY